MLSVYIWRINAFTLRIQYPEENDKKRSSYMHVGRTVTLRSAHVSKGFTDGISHTSIEKHIGRGSHTVGNDLLACHPPDLLSSSSHGWSKIQRTVPYITSLSSRSFAPYRLLLPSRPDETGKPRLMPLHPPCFILTKYDTSRDLIITCLFIYATGSVTVYAINEETVIKRSCSIGCLTFS